jgi:hypothetical protein
VTTTTTAKALLALLRRAGLAPAFDQTGGGCGTIFVPCADGQHQVMIGPFNYYADRTPEAVAALSIGVETIDEGDGEMGASFRSDAEFLYKVQSLVTSPHPMALKADDLDAAYLANFGMPKAAQPATEKERELFDLLHKIRSGGFDTVLDEDVHGEILAAIDHALHGWTP